MAAAQATVAGLENASQHLAVGMDVTKEQVVTETYESIKKHFGKNIDVVICNAGVQHIDPVDKLSFDNWRKIVSVHLDAAFLCTFGRTFASKLHEYTRKQHPSEQKQSFSNYQSSICQLGQ